MPHTDMAEPAVVTTIVIADDEPDLLALLRMIITSDSDAMVVSGQACDGIEAVELWRLCRPDVVILDHRMPKLTGLEAAAQIWSEDPGQLILLLTAHLDNAEVSRADALGLPVVSKVNIRTVPDVVRRLGRRP